MKNSLVRYGVIAIALVIAFILFTNQQKGTYSYRAELKSLSAEMGLMDEGFTIAMGNQPDGLVLDKASLKSYSDTCLRLIESYETLEGLPESASEDYQAFMEALKVQNDIQLQIVALSVEEEPILQEHRLALREAVEDRIFYDGRLKRY